MARMLAWTVALAALGGVSSWTSTPTMMVAKSSSTKSAAARSTYEKRRFKAQQEQLGQHSGGGAPSRRRRFRAPPAEVLARSLNAKDIRRAATELQDADALPSTAECEVALCALRRCLEWRRARALLVRMEIAAEKGVAPPPSALCYNIVAGACLVAGAIEEGRALVQRMEAAVPPVPTDVLTECRLLAAAPRGGLVGIGATAAAAAAAELEAAQERLESRVGPDFSVVVEGALGALPARAASAGSSRIARKARARLRELSDGQERLLGSALGVLEDMPRAAALATPELRGSTILDLHGAGVASGVLALRLLLNDAAGGGGGGRPLRPRGAALSLITGRGKHSPGGVAVLRATISSLMEDGVDGRAPLVAELLPNNPGVLSVPGDVLDAWADAEATAGR